MPRQLPWASSSGRGSKTQVLPPTSRLHDPKPKGRRRDDSDGDLPNEEAKRPHRELSSSPVAPPSPLKETYMKEGLGADDIWVMVEDEFLDTAKLFTRHLHRAEYQRLKLRAKAENAKRTNLISRPAADQDKVTPEHARKLKAESRDVKHQAAISKMAKFESISSDDEDAPWMREPHLNKLMRRPPQMAKDLSSAVGVRSQIRAAAGYSKARASSPSRVVPKSGRKQPKDYSSLAGLAQELGIVPEDSDHSDDYSDDLDGPVHRSSYQEPPSRSSSPLKKAVVRPSANLGTNSSKDPQINKFDRSHEPASRNSSVSAAVAERSRTEVNHSGRASTVTVSTQRTVRAPSVPARTEPYTTPRPRPVRRPLSKMKERKEQQKKSIALDEIPTFLF